MIEYAFLKNVLRPLVDWQKLLVCGNYCFEQCLLMTSSISGFSRPRFDSNQHCLPGPCSDTNYRQLCWGSEDYGWKYGIKGALLNYALYLLDIYSTRLISKRLAEAEEIADQILWVNSPMNSYMTVSLNIFEISQNYSSLFMRCKGTDVLCDGGYTSVWRYSHSMVSYGNLQYKGGAVS